MKQETYKTKKYTPPNMNIPTEQKTNVARAKKVKYNVKHLDTI